MEAKDINEHPVVILYLFPQTEVKINILISDMCRSRKFRQGGPDSVCISQRAVGT